MLRIIISILVGNLLARALPICDPNQIDAYFRASKSVYSKFAEIDLEQHPEYLTDCSFEGDKASIHLSVDGQHYSIDKNGSGNEIRVEISAEEDIFEDFTISWCLNVFEKFKDLTNLAGQEVVYDANDFHIDANASLEDRWFDFGTCSGPITIKKTGKSYNLIVNFGSYSQHIRALIAYNEPEDISHRFNKAFI